MYLIPLLTGAMRGPRYKFGQYEFYPETGDLQKFGVRIRLQRKPGQVLRALLERRGETITRRELHSQLWGGDTFVDFDQGLNVAVKKLRDALCDSTEEPRYIETVSGTGYRFIAEVEILELHDLTAAPRPSEPQLTSQEPTPTRDPDFTSRVSFVAKWVMLAALGLCAVLLFAAANHFLGRETHAQPQADLPVDRLVVLPFENLTADSNQEAFCDGLTEELIAQLGILSPQRLQVIGRTTSMHYKRTSFTATQVGTELKARYVVAGVVRRVSTLYRITVQLTDASSQTNIWTGTFDRELQDVLDVHRDVALAVGRQIGEVVSDRFQHPAFGSKPISPLAHEAYLRGRYLWNKRTVGDLRDSVDEFVRAIGIDPDYAEAHTGLADAYSLLASFGAIPFREGYPKARVEARKALDLNPHSAEARTSLAFVEAYFDWTFQRAEDDFRAAIRENPNYVTAHHWYGLFLSQRGRYSEALSELNTAAQLDPFSLAIGVDIANTYAYLGRYDEAERQLLKVRAIDPTYYGTYGTMAWLYALWGRMPEAEKENEAAKKLSGNYLANDEALAYAYVRSGQPARARDLLAQIARNAKEHGARKPCPLHVYLALREDAAALRCLDQAIAEHSDSLVPLLQDKDFLRIANDPQVQSRLKRAGLLSPDDPSHAGVTGSTVPSSTYDR